LLSSVKKCDELEKLSHIQQCYSGVFMENIVAHLDRNVGVFDKNDILYPCNTFEENYAQVCYYYQAYYISVNSKNSVGEECDKIKPVENIPYCYLGLGILIASQNIGKLEETLDGCLAVNTKYQNYCVVGSVLAISDLPGGTNNSIEFCKIVPENLKLACYEFLGTAINYYNYNNDLQIEIECSKVESSRFYEVCKEANLENTSNLFAGNYIPS